MLWTPEKNYHPEPFEKESDLEAAIQTVKEPLFGTDRIYLEVKRRIGTTGKTQNVPDAYLIDLQSPKKPKLWIVENELASHDPLKHIAVQVLEMSLSFEATPQRLKAIVKEALEKNKPGRKRCEEYAKANGFENIDYLLEEMIYRGEFGALVVIDELHDELETLLVSRFKFGVEVLTLNRYREGEGERIYEFEPLLTDVTTSFDSASESPSSPVDTSEIDTVVVPFKDDESFLEENRTYEVRMHASMIPKITYVAMYQGTPESAITHVAPVKNIEPWQNSGKYVIRFAEEPEELPQKNTLVAKGKGKGIRGVRYTSYKRLLNAKTLEEAF